MQNITIPTMVDYIRDIAIGEDDPCFFWGEPGCGKTEGIHGIPDLDIIDIRVGQYSSVDFRGFPGVDDDKTTIWHMPSTLPFVGNKRFDPDRPKLIFFDEANAALPAVSGVLYQVIQERRAGEHVLMPNTYIVAAGNRETDRGVTNRQPKPLSNRFVHFEVRPDAEAWCHWAATQPRMPSELIAWLQFQPNRISTFDPESTEKAYATPRAWEKVGRYFTNPNIPRERKEGAWEGTIGTGEAAGFVGFLRLLEASTDMPTVPQIIANPHGTPVPEKLEVRWAVSVSVSGEMTAQNTDALDTYLKRMDPDFRVACWQLAVRRDENLLGSKGFIELAQLYKDVFAAALSSRR